MIDEAQKILGSLAQLGKIWEDLSELTTNGFDLRVCWRCYTYNSMELTCYTFEFSIILCPVCGTLILSLPLNRLTNLS
jgi:hypothetical protein